MSNSFGIPEEIENRLRGKYKACAYCGRRMKRYLHAKGCPRDKATIEHLRFEGPIYWSDGLMECDLVMCCQSCNSSRGDKRLSEWLPKQQFISKVHPDVRQFLFRNPRI